MELQVQKYFLSAAPDFLNQSRSFAGEQFEADLEISYMAGKLICGSKRSRAIRNIQGDDES